MSRSNSISKTLSLSRLNINTNTDNVTIGEDTLTELLENNKGPQGPEGPEGPEGPQGPQGPIVKLIQQLFAYDTTKQTPTGTGPENAIKAKFGAPQTTTYIDLDASGNVTFKENGNYLIHGKGQYGRENTANTVLLHFRKMVNFNDGSGAVQVGDTISAEINNKKIVIPIEISFALNVTNAPYTLYFEVMRDLSETNDGGLYSFIPTGSTWNPSGSASILIERLM
jgi:hypothetical protein